jgi:hypothetical protein
MKNGVFWVVTTTQKTPFFIDVPKIVCYRPEED